MTVAPKVWNGSSWDPFGGGGSVADQYPSAPTSNGVTSASSIRNTVTLTAAGTANTWGSWTQLHSSLTADIDRLTITIPGNTYANGSDTSTLLQIGTGASSSEVALVTIAVGFSPGPRIIMIPAHIISGTRVAARLQSAVTSKSVDVISSAYASKTNHIGTPTMYGLDTGNSRGVVLSAPGSLNTKGSWTEITSATTADHTALLICPQLAGATNISTAAMLIDIGIGGSGSETVLVDDLYGITTASESVTWATPLLYGIDVPSGTRLSARYQRANANNTVDLFIVGA